MSKRIPGATYRLQFNREFTFAQAREVSGYLHELGITDCYASPLFKATEQSTHGYDVSDFGQLNPNLCTPEDSQRFASQLRDLQMGLIVDIVPNHMSTDTSNAAWFDVLENGPASKFANWFDIDWQRFGDDKLVLPILEDDFDKVLAAEKLRLVYENAKFFVAYHDRRFPISPDSQAKLSDQAQEHGLDSVLSEFNRIPGQIGTFQSLKGLLEQQHYRLTFWRAGQVNYRRFFDVNELVSLRMELPEVFEATHRLLSRLTRDGTVTGLRIDHPDGLWNPKQYLERLQQKFGDIYVVVEKILIDNELLPQDWPADGTTGYDFLNRLNGLFVAQTNREAFTHLYQKFSQKNFDFRKVVYEAKKQLLQNSFACEFDALARQLEQIAQSAGSVPTGLRPALLEVLANFPVYRTYVTEQTTELSPPDRHAINFAMSQASVCAIVGSEALQMIHDLLSLRWPTPLEQQRSEFVMKFQQLTGPLMAKAVEDTTFYNFNRLLSLNEVGGNPDTFGNSVDEFHEHNLKKAAHWPHALLATATHDTKRGEDLRARINVLSEIPDDWREVLHRWQSLNSGKKSAVNGQPAPDSNDEYFFYQTLIGAWPAQISNAEDLAAFRNRLLNYMLKAIKESKAHTSWSQPNVDYEEATKKFIQQTIDDSSSSVFLKEFQSFHNKIALFGRLNSLSQVLLKMTAPGVPDFYQGTELWDFNLVDPDNRRAVNYEMRRQFLEELKAQAAQVPVARLLADLLNDDQIGRSKLYLIWRVLEFRNRHRALFDTGSYLPLTSRGAKQNHTCAFARIQANQIAIVIAPRLFAGLTESECRLPLGPEIWEDTHLLLPDDFANLEFSNVLTSEKVSIAKSDRDSRLSLAQTLALFPVALLEGLAETR